MVDVYLGNKGDLGFEIGEKQRGFREKKEIEDAGLAVLKLCGCGFCWVYGDCGGSGGGEGCLVICEGGLVYDGDGDLEGEKR